MKELIYLCSFTMYRSMLLGYAVISFCLLRLASCSSFEIVQMEKTKIHDSCVTPINTISSPMIHHCISKCTSTGASTGSTPAPGSAGSNACNAIDYSDVSGSCVLSYVNYTSHCRKITSNSNAALKEIFVSKFILLVGK